MRDFPASSLLMGRSNYPTKDYSNLYNQTFSGVTCSDCTKRKVEDVLECKWCDPVAQCPYEIAKRQALKSNQVCSNTYYYLYEANHVGTLRNRELVIIDECDSLENILMSYVEVSFSQRQVSDFHLPTPSKKTVEDAWLQWAVEAKDVLNDQVSQLSEPTFQSSVQYVKTYNRINRAYSDVCRLTDLAIGLPAGGWIYTGYGEGNLQFRPVKVSAMAEQSLWRHGLRFLLMSATIISTQEMADSLGLNDA
jgi:Rad3-related DNA helicase